MFNDPRANNGWGAPMGTNLHNVMGSIGNLPPQQQSFFNRDQQFNNGQMFNVPMGMQQQPMGMNPPIKMSRAQGNSNWWEEISVPTQQAVIEPPAKKKTGGKGKKTGSDEKGKTKSKPTDKSHSKPAPEEPKSKEKTKSKDNPKSKDKPPKGSKKPVPSDEPKKKLPTRKISEAEEAQDAPPRDDVPLINLDQKSAPIWTMGSLLIFFLVLVCEILQTGGIASMATNPLIGPDQQTMILMGAKYAPLMLKGQYWRFFTAIFLHAGLAHIIIVLFIFLSTRSVERDSGFLRAIMVFFISGLYGYILSSLFIPEMVSVGATGALYGYLGLQLSDLFSSWRMYHNRWSRFNSLTGSIATTLIVGLTPFLDNFLHVGGFIMGFLFALMLLPNLTFGDCEKVCHGFIAFIAFPAMATLFCLCMVIFYRSVDSASSWCEWCHYINCVNISGWCPSINKDPNQNVIYFS